MSYKVKVKKWLNDAQERLKIITPGSIWYRETEKTIREYEKLLEQLGEKPERQPGEESEQ